MSDKFRRSFSQRASKFLNPFFSLNFIFSSLFFECFVTASVRAGESNCVSHCRVNNDLIDALLIAFQFSAESDRVSGEQRAGTKTTTNPAQIVFLSLFFAYKCKSSDQQTMSARKGFLSKITLAEHQSLKRRKVLVIFYQSRAENITTLDYE